MTHHRHLCEIAEEAINEVFSDTSVSAAKKLDSLAELRAMCDIKIEALREDLSRGKVR